jgi:hypothetical protein
MSRHAVGTARRRAGEPAHCLPESLGKPAIQQQIACESSEHCFGRHDGVLFNSLIGAAAQYRY